MDEQTLGIVEAGFLTVCSREMAYEWLERRIPDRSVYRDAPFTGLSNKDYLERILLNREDSLIDYGLARFGWSAEIANTLYDRLDHYGKCTMRSCHLSGGGPLGRLGGARELSEELFEELAAWVVNPYHRDDFFEQLIKKSGCFSDLNQQAYMNALYILGKNTRLSKPYQSLYLDGYDEYRYNNVFHLAWDLTRSVEPSQQWASCLEGLLSHIVNNPGPEFDVLEVLKRWRVDDKPVDVEKWYSNSSSLFLRARIAELLKPSEQMINSDDLAVRLAFYKMFNPEEYREWPTFLEKDSAAFFDFAMENLNIWKNSEERERLRQLSWEVPDPHHMMDAHNSFRGRERDMMEKYPHWFQDEAPL